jgi:hypothetical protein
VITWRGGGCIDNKDGLHPWFDFCLHACYLHPHYWMGSLCVVETDYEFIVLLALLLCIRMNFTTNIIAPQFRVYILFNIHRCYLLRQMSMFRSSLPPLPLPELVLAPTTTLLPDGYQFSGVLVLTHVKFGFIYSVLSTSSHFSGNITRYS